MPRPQPYGDIVSADDLCRNLAQATACLFLDALHAEHDRLFHAMEGLAAHKFAQMLRANGDGDHLAEPHCLRRVFGQTDVRRKREFSHMPLAERAQVGGALPAPHADLVPNLMQIPRDK